MDRPLHVLDMKNVTLKSSDSENVQPVLVPRFPCVYSYCLGIVNISSRTYHVGYHGPWKNIRDFYYEKNFISVCCSVVHVINVSHAYIDGIQIAANASGLIIENCTDIHISNSLIVANKEHTSAVGTLVYKSSRILVDTLQANNFSWGIATSNSVSIIISNTRIQNCSGPGVYILDSDSVSVVNVMSQNNRHGIVILSTNHTTVTDSTLVNNVLTGIMLVWAKSSDINHTLSDSNGFYGFYLDTCTNTLVNGVHANHNAANGFLIDIGTNLIMINITVKQSQKEGMFILNATGKMESVHVYASSRSGIYFIDCDMYMENVYASNNVHGMYFVRSSMYMENIHVSNNAHGMICLNSDMCVENVYTEYNRRNGIELDSCNVSMALVSSNHNLNLGIYVHNSMNTTLMNLSTIGNGGNGIYLQKANNTRITFLSSKFNSKDGLLAKRSDFTTLTDSHLVHNKGGDINLIYSTNFSIVRTAASITAHRSQHIYLGESIFSGMSSSSTFSSTVDPINLPAIVELYDSNATVYNCSFTNNTVSGIKAIGSEVTFSGELTFSHNRALTGSVLIFARRSTLILTENCDVFFTGNHASRFGGVIYINTEESYVTSMTLYDILTFLDDYTVGSLTTSRTECFIRVEGSRSDMRLVFVNNTAGKGGDVLYGGLVALGWDDGWNCLLSFKNISDMSQQSGLSTITSNPSRICFCKDAEPDCLTVADPITHHIYPGQTITIPAVVVGQDFGTVTGSVYAKVLNTSFVEIGDGQNITNIDQSQCHSIKYTIFSENEGSEAVLVLTADNIDISYTLNQSDNQAILNSWTILNSEPNYNILASNIGEKFHKYYPMYTEECYEHLGYDKYNPVYTGACYESLAPSDNRTIDNFYKFTDETVSTLIIDDKVHHFENRLIFPKKIYGYPIYITISFLPCPAGFTLTTEKPFKCDCNHQLQQLPAVKCHIQYQTINRSGLVWVGSDGNETVITSQQCPLDYCKQEDIKVTLDNPDSQCNYNHSGTLCGGCQAGLSLVLGSNRCQQCSNAHIALLLPFAISGIVLVFFIKVTDLTVSQGTLNSFIFYANVIKTNEYLFFPQKTPLTVFISWLNLDLGIETCFYNGLSAYAKVWLQFVFPLYIWSIAGLIIVLSRYSDGVAKVMGNNSVPVLATLLLLSYAKLLRTIISALSLSVLTTADGSKAVWSADGNLDYLGPKHAPLFLAAIATLLFLWLPYTLVLFSGQWLYRCKSQLVTRMLTKMKPFLDAHYGPMKSNHRYWYGTLLILRVTILLLSALVPANHASVIVFCITVCSIVLTNFALMVYQNIVVATFVAIVYANLGILTASHTFTALEDYSFLLPSNVLVGLVFTQFIGLVLFKIVVIFNMRQKIRQWIHKPGPTEDDGDDDWELYEEAALLREREAEMEREADLGGKVGEENENESADSIPSLPTYGI